MMILIADDEQGIRNSLREFLKTEHEVLTCADGREAAQILEKTSIDLVITDQMMPHLSGLELIHIIKSRYSSTSVLMMTAHGSVEQAVQAIQAGADDYLLKPIEFTEIEHRIQRIEELRAWKCERALKLHKTPPLQRITGNSPSVRAAKEFVEKVASAPSPVLLLGPSGSGKEVLARAIHESGAKPDRPFIAINCASLSEQLMESELFGHEKGAFTGANQSKPGKFELARGGTLFLDEIGELAPGIQAKLLRVLQEKEFYRVGGVRQIKSDARVIAATHRPLKEMVEGKTFREDLFFRLSVLTFELPPLSQRREDLPLLIDHFWAQLSQDLNRKLVLSPEARERLEQYDYPGNIRELKNLIERLLVLGPSQGAVLATHLPPEVQGSAPVLLATALPRSPGAATNLDLNAQIEDLEKSLIQEAMSRTGFNQIKAAELLKITRGTLQYKLKKYGLNPSEAA